MLQTNYIVNHPKKTRNLVIGLCSDEADLRQYQRLRYIVYEKEFGYPQTSAVEHIDEDIFDRTCDHLLVKQEETGEVVGGYRLLTGKKALRIGGFYADEEFDLVQLNSRRSHLLEIGRACVHPNYRTGATLALLWREIVKYAFTQQCRYIMGSASVSLKDNGAAARAIMNISKPTDINFTIRPRRPLPKQFLSGHSNAPIVPLIKSYLRAGALIIGQPTWDSEFNTADFFMFLPLAGVTDKYARHFVKSENSERAPS